MCFIITSALLYSIDILLLEVWKNAEECRIITFSTSDMDVSTKEKVAWPQTRLFMITKTPKNQQKS